MLVLRQGIDVQHRGTEKDAVIDGEGIGKDNKVVAAERQVRHYRLVMSVMLQAPKVKERRRR